MDPKYKGRLPLYVYAVQQNISSLAGVCCCPERRKEKTATCNQIQDKAQAAFSVEWLGTVPGHVSHETQDAGGSSAARETRCTKFEHLDCNRGDQMTCCIPRSNFCHLTSRSAVVRGCL